MSDTTNPSATSESGQIHQDGLDHIKANTSGFDSSSAPSTSAADDSLSGTETSTTGQSGILGTVKSYLGYGGAAGDGTTDTPSTGAGSTFDQGSSAGTYPTDTSSTGAGSTFDKGSSAGTYPTDTSSTGAGSTFDKGSTAGQPTTTDTTSTGAGAVFDKGSNTQTDYTPSDAPTATSGTTANPAKDSSLPGHGSDNITSTDTTNTAAGDASNQSYTSKAGEYLAGGAAAASAAAAGATAKVTGSSSAAQKSEQDEAKSAENLDSAQEGGSSSSSSEPVSDKVAAKRENESAIPTAGGERLGEKHWGESKIVPDVPKKRDSEVGEGAGVSSAAGQPTEETRANTAANTGATPASAGSDSTGATDSGEGKEKLVDKIKDKLHIGGH